MNENDRKNQHPTPAGSPASSRRQPVTRVPSDSLFYGKAVPALLLFLVIVTMLLIVITVWVVLFR